MSGRVFAAFLSCLASLAQAQTVCIDPGHPSEVGRGTQGRKVTELHEAWIVAKAVQRKLAERRIQVVLTKNSENEFVRNRERSEIANRARADFMLRLHCDASNESGFGVYYPDREGTSEGVTGPSRAVLLRTLPMARAFHDAMRDALKGKLFDRGLMPDTRTAVGAKQGALTGSIYSNCPVVLVEMVVLTNPRDEAFITSKAGFEAMVDALTDAAVAALRAVPAR